MVSPSPNKLKFLSSCGQSEQSTTSELHIQHLPLPLDHEITENRIQGKSKHWVEYHQY